MMGPNDFEEAIENKEITPDQLPENSAIQNEAKQLYDNNPNNDEVSNEINNDFFENFVKSWKKPAEQSAEINNPNDINYTALQNWANNVKDDPTILDRGVAYSLNDVKDKKDLDSYKWAQQNNYNAAQDKLKKASSLMKKAREGDEFNNEYRKAAGAISFPAGAARARAQKNMNVADALLNEDIGNETLSEALHNKDLIRNLKGTKDEVDRQDILKDFLSKYRQSLQEKNTQQAEQLIEDSPEIAAEALPEESEGFEEAQQIINDDDDKRNDEVNNEEIKKDEQFGMGWNNGKVDTFDKDAPTYHADPIEGVDEDFVGPDEMVDENGSIVPNPDYRPEDVVDYGIEDQNQYNNDLVTEDELEDKTIIEPSMNEAPVNEDDFEQAPELPYADNILQMKQNVQNVPEDANDEKLGIVWSGSGVSMPTAKSDINIDNNISHVNGGSIDNTKSSGPVKSGGGETAKIFHDIMATSSNSPKKLTYENIGQALSSMHSGSVPKMPETSAPSSHHSNGPTTAMFKSIMSGGKDAGFKSGTSNLGKNSIKGIPTSKPKGKGDYLKQAGKFGLQQQTNRVQLLVEKITEVLKHKPNKEFEKGSVHLKIVENKAKVKYGSYREVLLSTFAVQHPKEVERIYQLIK